MFSKHPESRWNPTIYDSLYIIHITTCAWSILIIDLFQWFIIITLIQLLLNDGWVRLKNVFDIIFSFHISDLEIIIVFRQFDLCYLTALTLYHIIKCIVVFESSGCPLSHLMLYFKNLFIISFYFVNPLLSLFILFLMHINCDIFSITPLFHFHFKALLFFP